MAVTDGSTPARTVVVLPGRSFGAFVPPLFFPMMAALRCDAEPVTITWHDLAALDDLPIDQWSRWVVGQVESQLRDRDPATTLVVGKSLGSLASGLVAELGIPAIWVTPVLTNDDVVAGLRRARSPFLLAGGTADRMWRPAVARDLTRHVVEVAGADHGLSVPGPLGRSAGALARLADGCETFLDQLGWLPSPHLRVVAATREVAAPADRVFELIADPAQQPRWDGNDNLASSEPGQRVRAVGDVFTTMLTMGSVRENHVVEFTEGTLIAWRPSEVGSPRPGHLWRWELEEIDAGRTRVTHTYDWSQLTDPDRYSRARATTEDSLRSSLDRLAALAERD